MHLRGDPADDFVLCELEPPSPEQASTSPGVVGHEEAVHGVRKESGSTKQLKGVLAAVIVSILYSYLFDSEYR